MITLKTLPQATAQKVFDQVATHLLTQNKKSLNENKSCVYLSQDGSMCAAGCLIGDPKKARELDDVLFNTSWNALVQELIVPADHQNLIATLQNIHDCNEVNEWKQRLKILAKSKKLDDRVLEKF